jgi:hypothetical protein
MSQITTESDTDCEVMASVDEGPDGGERLVIADLCRDDAWISMPAAAASVVTDHR